MLSLSDKADVSDHAAADKLHHVGGDLGSAY